MTAWRYYQTGLGSIWLTCGKASLLTAGVDCHRIEDKNGNKVLDRDINHELGFRGTWFQRDNSR